MPRNRLALPATKEKIAKLVVLGAVSSTNDYVKEHIRELDPFSLVVTDNQTNGRGRQGRSWVSRRGEGLALSLVVPLPPSSGLSWLPLVAGACLVHALRAHGVAGASLKWPNDVLVNNRKLAGVLCETVGEGCGVVGVGINISFPPEIPPSPHATALDLVLDGGASNLDLVVSVFVAQLMAWHSQTNNEQVSQAKELTERVMGTLGAEVKVIDMTGESWRGFAESLDQSGHLLVREEGARSLRTVIASDIEHLRQ